MTIVCITNALVTSIIEKSSLDCEVQKRRNKKGGREETTGKSFVPGQKRVCACVRLRSRERECVRVRVCACVRLRERERDRARERERERVRVRVCACVAQCETVRERKRERERERDNCCIFDHSCFKQKTG